MRQDIDTLYKALKADMPSPDLDEKIFHLARDKQATNTPNSKRLSRWKPGLALAASLLLGISLLIQMPREQWNVSPASMSPTQLVGDFQDEGPKFKADAIAPSAEAAIASEPLLNRERASKVQMRSAKGVMPLNAQAEKAQSEHQAVRNEAGPKDAKKRSLVPMQSPAMPVPPLRRSLKQWRALACERGLSPEQIHEFVSDFPEYTMAQLKSCD